MLLLSLLACGALDAGADPIVEAHRGAAGYWPQNSRTSLTSSVAAGYDAIEFDVVITADDQAVISHDPWVHEELCTRADGSPIRVLLVDDEPALTNLL